MEGLEVEPARAKLLFTTMLLASLNFTSTRIGLCIVNIINTIIHAVQIFQEVNSQGQEIIETLQHYNTTVITIKVQIRSRNFVADKP